MSQTVVIATAPVGTDDSAERLRLDAAFDARWAAWQRGAESANVVFVANSSCWPQQWSSPPQLFISS